MGKEPFFHPGQENYRKLQPFGGMERHQCKFIVIQLGIVNVGNQRYVFQKTGQGFLFPFILQKILRHADQFLQVFRPALRLGRPLRMQLFQIARLVHHIFNELFHRNRVHLCHQIKQNAAHLFQPGNEAGTQPRHCCRVGNDLEQGNALRIGMILQLIDSGLSDAPPGYINNTQQAQRIIRIVQQLQVGHHIPDLFPVVKLHAAHHAVTDSAFDQHFFKNTGLGVGTVQHGHVAVGKTAAADQHLGLLHHKPCLVPLVHGVVKGDCRACRVFRPQLFRLAPCVVFDYRIGRVQYYRSGTVILFQLQQFRVGIILFKVQDVADVRAAPAVNALVRVAHHAQVPLISRQKARKQVLGPVGILVLVNHDIAKTLLIFFPHLRELRQYLYRQHQQVVKVHGIVGQQPFLV